jgi:hypothetical protein
MPRDNTIKVYRSGGNAAPPSFSANSAVGPTFGELAYVDGLTSLYIGMSGGGLLWIGAEVTGGSISQGLEYAVPTMKAVKDYVTGTQSGYFIVRGEDGLTQQIDLAGTLTITGGTGIDVLKSSSANTIIVTGLTATTTSWGVVKVNSGGPIIIDDNGLNIGTDRKLFTIQDEVGNTDEVGYDNILTITGGRGVDVYRTATNPATLSVLGATATYSTLGVASFNNTYFSVENGAVTLTGGPLFTVRDEKQTSTNIAAGDVLTITGGPGINVFSDGTDRLAVQGVTATYTTLGVASFNASSFTVTNGAVGLTTGALFSVSDNILGNVGVDFGDSLGIEGVGANSTTVAVVGQKPYVYIDTRLASTSLTGVASFSSTDFSVNAAGQVSFATSAVQFTIRDSQQTTDTISNKNTLTITGGSGIITVKSATDTISVRGVTATSSALGVASFSPTHFVVTDGAVALATPYTITGDTVTTSGALSVTRTNNQAALNVRLGDTSLTGVVSFDAQYFSVGNTGHVRITMVDGGTFS